MHLLRLTGRNRTPKRRWPHVVVVVDAELLVRVADSALEAADRTVAMHLSSEMVAAAFLTSGITTLLASIPPAWRVSRIPVVDALRQNV
jgi:ABC-type lipoprotein release transport system permease subunit